MGWAWLLLPGGGLLLLLGSLAARQEGLQRKLRERLSAGWRQFEQMNRPWRIELIGAGAPRTGTQSLALALATAGGFRTMHGTEYYWTPSLQRPWKAWLYHNGSFEAGLQEIRKMGGTATLDLPYNMARRELMERFPDAKVILTVRDSTSWYRSIEKIQAIYRQATTDAEVALLRQVGFSEQEAAVGMRHFRADYLRLLDCDLASEPGDQDVRRRCIAGFDRLIAEVKREVPPERLLVYDVKEGWEPLCRFLSVPVPAAPFPRVDQNNRSAEAESCGEGRADGACTAQWELKG